MVLLSPRKIFVMIVFTNALGNVNSNDVANVVVNGENSLKL